MAVALVLSGGAAQGSVEVGALKYLYENGFCADIICSASVGSVNGLELAHGGDPPSQKAAFDKLKSVWETELKFNADMYTEAAWLKRVSEHAKGDETSFASVDWASLVAWRLLFPPFFAAVVADVIREVVRSSASSSGRRRSATSMRPACSRRNASSRCGSSTRASTCTTVSPSIPG